MVIATDLRPGVVVRFEGDLHKVLESAYQAGGGKLTGTVHSKLQNLRTGSVIERRFRPEERLERVELERAQWQYIYEDASDYYFMNPETYEQMPISRDILGEASRFLRPEMTVTVETFDGRPVNVIFPEAVELRVMSTAQPAHQQQTSTLKSATLENGMEVLVPLFIKDGDLVRIDTATGKYLERVRAKSG